MRRKLFHILAALSLLLMIGSCIATAHDTMLKRFGESSAVEFGFHRGFISFSTVTYYGRNDSFDVQDQWHFASNGSMARRLPRYGATTHVDLGLVTLSTIADDDRNVQFRRAFGVTLASPLLFFLLALLPLVWVKRFRRRRKATFRRRRNLCTACRYDLRGSVGKTCPECGAATA